MKLKHFLTVGSAIVAVAAAAPASAATLLFNFSGPSGNAQFLLDSNPTPDFSTSFAGSAQFGFNNVTGTFGGMPGSATSITFGNGIFASFNMVAPDVGFAQYVSPALFSGTANSPVFATGTFELVNPIFGNATLTIAQTSAAVPEPASWAMLLLGFGFVGVTMRAARRKQKLALSVTLP